MEENRPTGVMDLKSELNSHLDQWPTAEISAAGAHQAATVAVELEEKLILKKTHPADIWRCAIVASMLINRWLQLNRQHVSGSISWVTDDQTINETLAKLKGGGLEKEEMKTLFAKWYVADPAMGAGRAMEVFRKLKGLYPNIRLR